MGEQVLSRIAGEKSYELVNHLGNVLSVVSDKKVYDRDWQADLQSSQDYYAFGMQMPGRSYNSDAYRFGFNGKENDNEVKGVGNSVDFGARLYDSRLGRWLSLDPKAAKFPSWSPYSFAFNNPIIMIDPDGEEPTAAAYKAAATALGVSVAHIRAVYSTEVGKSAYLADGRVKILFERHYFSERTKGKFDESDPDISSPTPGGYGTFSSQYDKLERAVSLDKDAAYESISIGGLQIMGANYKAVGFGSAEEFINTMISGSEDDHLNAFVNFIVKDKFAPQGKTKLDALKDSDWKSFARNYNGPRYKDNDYDKKLEDAYNKYKEDPLKGIEEKITEKTTKEDKK